MFAGEDPDPVSTVLENAFGSVGFRVVLVIVLISFLSCVLSLQAAASRMIYAYARDDMVPGSGLLKRFSQARHVPPYALSLAALIPVVIILGSQVSDDALVRIISFASFGIYLAFMMVVAAALRARLRGGSRPGRSPSAAGAYW